MFRKPLSGMMVTLLLTAGVGCVQRTITLESDPPGAVVYLNDEEVGRTPTTIPFTFYGTYDVRLEKEGYETLNTEKKANAPWWETPGLDLVAELLPWQMVAEQNWQFDLEPARPVNEELLVDHARQLRATLNQEIDPKR